MTLLTPADLPDEDERLDITYRHVSTFDKEGELFIVDRAFPVESMHADTEYDHFKIIGTFESDHPQTPTRGIRIYTGDRGIALGASRVDRVESLDSDFEVEAP